MDSSDMFESDVRKMLKKVPRIANYLVSFYVVTNFHHTIMHKSPFQLHSETHKDREIIGNGWYILEFKCTSIFIVFFRQFHTKLCISAQKKMDILLHLIKMNNIIQICIDVSKVEIGQNS